MEPIAIGAILREALGIALRHWAIFALALLALTMACVANIVLIFWCLLWGACLSFRVFMLAPSQFDTALWVANRLAAWAVCGLAMQRLMASEAARHFQSEGGRIGLRGYGRCVLYLAALSAIGYLAEPIDRFLQTLSDAGWGMFIFHRVSLVAIWAYLDARLAFFIATAVFDGRPMGLNESWRVARANRLQMFALFFLIEGSISFLSVAYFERGYFGLDFFPLATWLEHLTSMPADFLVLRLPAIAGFAPYVVLTDLLCACAFFAIYRRHLLSAPEHRAEIFD
jgi:hypothetical protein